MKKYLSVFLIVISTSAFAQKKATLLVNLTPAGSFQAVSDDLKGNLIKSGDTFSADKITARIKTFKTGIELRDEHFWKHLNFKQHDKAILTNLKGKGGKAVANLEVNGVKKPVAMTYKEKGEAVEATMKVKASDFKLPKASYLGVGVSDVVQIDVVMAFKNK